MASNSIYISNYYLKIFEINIQQFVNSSLKSQSLWLGLSKPLALAIIKLITIAINFIFIITLFLSCFFIIFFYHSVSYEQISELIYDE
jgi:hypothetical protein